MKNAILLQGAGETQESFWLPYLKIELEKRGYEVWLPQLPGIDNPKLKEILPFVLKNGNFDKDTVIVAHSAGVPITFSVLENTKTKIKKAVLVAGLTEPSTSDPDINKWQENFLQKAYDWQKIKSNCQEFVFVASVNDPWGCNDKQARKMFNELGGTLIINDDQGHMGSDKFKQPYKKFPLLVKLVDEKLWGDR